MKDIGKMNNDYEPVRDCFIVPKDRRINPNVIERELIITPFSEVIGVIVDGTRKAEIHVKHGRENSVLNLYGARIEIFIRDYKAWLKNSHNIG